MRKLFLGCLFIWPSGIKCHRRMKEASQYKRNVIADRGKGFFSSLLDYAMTFVLSFLLFWVAGNPILGAMPLSADAYSKMGAYMEEASSIVSATGLQYSDSSGELQGIEKTADRFVRALSMTWFYVHDTKMPSSSGVDEAVLEGDTFLADGMGEYPYDGLAQYFFCFKASGEGISSYIYDGVDYSMDKQEGLYAHLLGFDLSSPMFSKIYQEGMNPYYCISQDYAYYIADYLAGDTSTKNEEAYNEIYNPYLSVLSQMVNEVETLYVPYQEAMAGLDEAANTYYGSYFLVYSLSLLLAFCILESLFPLLWHGKTIGIKSFRLGYSTNEETEPEWWRYLLKSLARFPIHYSSLFLGIWMFDFDLLTLIFTLDLGGGFRMSYILLFTVVYSLASLVSFLIRKDHQGLSEMAGGLLLKDTEMSEPGTPEEEKMDGE